MLPVAAPAIFVIRRLCLSKAADSLLWNNAVAGTATGMDGLSLIWSLKD
jgi:hypothetical protein